MSHSVKSKNRCNTAYAARITDSLYLLWVQMLRLSDPCMDSKMPITEFVLIQITIKCEAKPKTDLVILGGVWLAGHFLLLVWWFFIHDIQIKAVCLLYQVCCSLLSSKSGYSASQFLVYPLRQHSSVSEMCLWSSAFTHFWPTSPSPCFVRIPILYLTFWTRVPKIEP